MFKLTMFPKFSNFEIVKVSQMFPNVPKLSNVQFFIMLSKICPKFQIVKCSGFPIF